MRAYEKTMGILLEEANSAIKYRIIGEIYNGGSTTQCLQLKSKLQNIVIMLLIPKNFKGRPIIRPELYEDGQIKLQLEYDIYGFVSIRNELLQDYKNKVEEIITHIMELLSNFEIAIQKEWFLQALKLVETYKDETIIRKIILRRKTLVGY